MKLRQFIFVGMAVCLGTLARAQTTITDNTYAPGAAAAVVGPYTVTTSGAVVVSSQAIVVFKATQSISLEPGFHASAGSSFDASVTASTWQEDQQAMLIPSATTVQPGQTVSFTVFGECTSGLDEIDLESYDVLGAPTVINTWYIYNPYQSVYEQSFSWTAPLATGTYNFDSYVLNSDGNQLLYTPIITITVQPPPSTPPPPTIAWTTDSGPGADTFSGPINPAVVGLGQAYMIRARGRDVGGNLAGISIYKNGQFFTGAGGGDGTVYIANSTSSDGPGTVTYTAWAGDSAGVPSNSITWTVTVVDRPITVLTSTTTSTAFGSAVTLTCTTTDLSGPSILSQAIDYSTDGGITWIGGNSAAGSLWVGTVPTAHTLSWTYAPTAAGTVQFRARGQDNIPAFSDYAYVTLTVANPQTQLGLKVQRPTQ